MKLKLFLLFFLLFLGMDFRTLYAADEELQSPQGITYACTGVGESKDDPRWKTYPLKLMFTGAGHAYVADVKVTVLDSRHQEVLKISCDAPWLLIKLKPGSYQIQAEAEGSTQKAQVQIGATGRAERVIRFPNISDH